MVRRLRYPRMSAFACLVTMLLALGRDMCLGAGLLHGADTLLARLLRRWPQAQLCHRLEFREAELSRACLPTEILAGEKCSAQSIEQLGGARSQPEGAAGRQVDDVLTHRPVPALPPPVEGHSHIVIHAHD